MTRQTVPSNAPNAPEPVQVVLPGLPTRSRVRFSLAGGVGPAEASVWAQTALTPYNYAQDIPLLRMAITLGGVSVEQDLPLNMAYYDFLFAKLDLIDRSQIVAASVSLVI